MYFKVKIDPKSQPTMASYYNIQVAEPTLMKIEGTNGGVLKLPNSTSSLWMNDEEYFRLERLAQLEYNNDSKAQSNVVTANDLLKAIAITKDSTLATQLIKD